MRHHSLNSKTPTCAEHCPFSNVFLHLSGIQLILPPCFQTWWIHNVANKTKVSTVHFWTSHFHGIMTHTVLFWDKTPAEGLNHPGNDFIAKSVTPTWLPLAFPTDPSPFQVMSEKGREQFSPIPTDWHHQTHSEGQYQDVPTDRLAEWLVYTCVTVSVPTQTVLWENTLTGDISRNSSAVVVAKTQTYD